MGERGNSICYRMILCNGPERLTSVVEMLTESLAGWLVFEPARKCQRAGLDEPPYNHNFERTSYNLKPKGNLGSI